MEIFTISKIFSKAVENLNFQLLGVSPHYVWRDGQRTDELIGYQYLVLSRELGWEKLTVKTSELQPIITQQELDVMEDSGEVVELCFAGLKSKLWIKERALNASFTADSATIV